MTGVATRRVVRGDGPPTGTAGRFPSRQREADSRRAADSPAVQQKWRAPCRRSPTSCERRCRRSRRRRRFRGSRRGRAGSRTRAPATSRGRSGEARGRGAGSDSARPSPIRGPPGHTRLGATSLLATPSGPIPSPEDSGEEVATIAARGPTWSPQPRSISFREPGRTLPDHLSHTPWADQAGDLFRSRRVPRDQFARRCHDVATDSSVPRSEPSHSGCRPSGDGGTMSATGFPKRVTRSARPVRRTRSRVARQVALNFEIGMDSMPGLYHGLRPWSICPRDSGCRLR